MLFEGQGHVALIGKSALRCHTSKRHILLFEQMSRSLNTQAQNKLVWTFSCRLAEQAREVIGTEASLSGQCFKREVLIEMSLRKVHDPPHLVLRQPC